MDARARDVKKIGDKLFERKRSLDSLYQEIAYNFYPERADFTQKRSEGEEFADHLYTSFPVIARRELASLVASALRPRAEKWFSLHVENKDVDDRDEERQFLEYLADVQWRAMYDSSAGFVRATKQADHDFVTFGNAVLKFGPNVAADGLLFRNYHLRDCAWAENAEGRVDCLHRKWKASAKQLKEHFPTKVSGDVEKALKQDPFKEFECRHAVMPSKLYDYKSPSGRSYPYVSVIFECATETILEEIGLNYFPYVVPRWHTIDGSAYGTSMATAICLPDGRTCQVVARTTMEAGEKFVDPPMLAFGDAIRGDYALYAGGITIADIEYDERSGEVLRPINQDRSGWPIAETVAEALREDIRNGFFLNQIQAPEPGTDMTAYEFRQRLQEHMRAAAPVFEPIEQEYNDPLCEGVFQVLRDFGAFPVDQMPETLSGQDIKFSFRSPMAEMAEMEAAEIFVDVRDRILGPIAEMDPSQLENVDWTAATRDAMRAAGFKSKWMKPVEAVMQKAEQLAKQAEMQAGMAAIQEAGAAAQTGAAGMAAMEQMSGQ